MSDTVHRPPTARHSSSYEVLMRAIDRGVTAFFRNSSLHQARYCRGGQRAQEENLDHLLPFGVDLAHVSVIRAYGESGEAGRPRPQFGELEARIRRKLVGLLILARHDRLGRNESDAARILDAMREHGVLLMVAGRVYDPSDEGDDFILGIHAKVAQLENRARARWMSAARFANARRLEARRGLPQGFVWACLEDDDYRSRALAAGLEPWLAAAAHARVRSPAGDRVLRILPFPDADVVRSGELRVAWMLETGDADEVLRRISEDPEWPRPGRVPVVGRPAVGRDRQVYLYRYTPDLEVGWEEATRAGLRRWLATRAVYGCYEYLAPGLAEPLLKAQLRDVARRPGTGAAAE